MCQQVRQRAKTAWRGGRRSLATLATRSRHTDRDAGQDVCLLHALVITDSDEQDEQDAPVAIEPVLTTTVTATVIATPTATANPASNSNDSSRSK